MNTLIIADEKLLVRDRNVIAAVLSIVPGGGHLYKGHYGTGLMLLFGLPFVLWAGLLLSLATAGLGLLLPAFYWVMASLDAYHEVDWRKHHWLGIM